MHQETYAGLMSPQLPVEHTTKAELKFRTRITRLAIISPELLINQITIIVILVPVLRIVKMVLWLEVTLEIPDQHTVLHKVLRI